MYRSIAREGQRDSDVLAALTDDLERSVPTLEVEVLDVGAQGFGDAQAVEGQQRCQGVVTRRAEAGLERNPPSSLRSSPSVRDS